MRKHLNIIALSAWLISYNSAFADPSKLIAEMINTPASTFDLFLTRIWLSYGCASSKTNQTCIKSVDYNFSDNIIQITFDANLKDYDAVERFSTAKNEEEKTDIIHEVLTSVVKWSGVTANTSGVKAFSILYETPIRFGWKDTEVNEDNWRSEIASRTDIKVFIHTHPIRYLANDYLAIRSHRGDIRVEKLKKY